MHAPSLIPVKQFLTCHRKLQTRLQTYKTDIYASVTVLVLLKLLEMKSLQNAVVPFAISKIKYLI